MNRVFIIGGRSYNMASPTTQKLSLAGKHLEKEIDKASGKDTIGTFFQAEDESHRSKMTIGANLPYIIDRVPKIVPPYMVSVK